MFVKEPGAAREECLLLCKEWDMKTLVGILTGQCFLNYPMRKIGVVVSFICSQNGQETALHFICSCPTSSLRFSLTKNVRSLCLWRLLLDSQKPANVMPLNIRYPVIVQ